MHIVLRFHSREQFNWQMQRGIEFLTMPPAHWHSEI